VTHLLHLQPVDLHTQTDQLARQTVILEPHLPLYDKEGKERGKRLARD
jgi:hypothetical protein